MTRSALSRAASTDVSGQHAIGTDVPVSEYGIDSLGLLEFLFALEEEFQVHLSPDPSDESQTLRKLAELVEQLQRSSMSPAQPTP
jgi:acyl carrier protein